MKKILLLLTLTMLTACFGGFGDSSSSGSSNGSIDQNDFYLGSDFTIDSFHGQTFKQETNTSNYTVDDINPTGQTADDIAGYLRAAIEGKLDTNNDINYNLKTHSIDGDIASKRLIITYPITISAKGGNDSLSNTYSFTINFNNETTPPSGNLDFSLGDDFTIKSIDKKRFTRSTSTTYVVDDINPVDKTRINIIDELERAIHAKHRPNSKINYTLDEPTTEGSITQNQNFVVKFGIEISEQANSNNSRNGTYFFTIKFNGETTPPPFEVDFDLGSTFTVPSFKDELFMSTDDKFLNYSIGNIDPETIVEDNIAGELTTAINAVHDANDKINYTLGEPQNNITVQQMTVTFPITISEKAGGNNSKKGTYTFTIKFAGPTVPWDGETFTKPNISADYYLIKVPANLAWLGEQTEPIKTNVKFMNDINMGSKPFKGIVEFTGIFDGNNKTIRNISITAPPCNEMAMCIDLATGLIDKTTGEVIIKNLNLDSGKITGNMCVGGFIGTVGVENDIFVNPTQKHKHKLTIDNVTSNLELKSNHRFASYGTVMGGFVATIYNADSTIINSTHSGTIQHEIHASNITGGFIGRIWNSDMKMKNLVNQSEISTTSASTNTVGGIIGYNISDDTNHSFNFHGDNLTNNGDINSDTSSNSATYSGGIIGFSTTNLSTITLENIHNKGNITFTTDAGGIIGAIYSTKSGNSGGDGILSIINSSNIGVIKMTKNSSTNNTAGGIIGHNSNDNPSIIKDTHNTGKIITTTDTNGGGIIGYNDGDGSLKIENSSNTGDVTFNNIGIYAAYSSVGGIIGVNSMSLNHLEVDNISNSGNITGDSHVAGLIGDNKVKSAKLTKMSNTGKIISNGTKVSTLYAAGLIGSNYGPTEISSSYNKGDVAILSSGVDAAGSSTNYISGLIGDNIDNITVTKSYNTGNIKITNKNNFDNKVGGLVGRTRKYTHIIDSYNTGNLESAGATYQSYVSIGGIIGYAGRYVTVSGSYNTGDVNSTNNINDQYSSFNFVGGIIGTDSTYHDEHNGTSLTITDSYNTGTVKSTSRAGGIFGGHLYNRVGNIKIEIVRSFSYADVTASGDSDSVAGAIVGKYSDNIQPPVFTNNYWCAPTTKPPSNPDAGTKLTVGAFKVPSNFSTWNIGQTGSKWTMLQNALYPTLINNPEVVAP